jgi:hypothetical protein
VQLWQAGRLSSHLIRRILGYSQKVSRSVTRSRWLEKRIRTGIRDTLFLTEYALHACALPCSRSYPWFVREGVSCLKDANVRSLRGICESRSTRGTLRAYRIISAMPQRVWFSKLKSACMDCHGGITIFHIVMERTVLVWGPGILPWANERRDTAPCLVQAVSLLSRNFTVSFQSCATSVGLR